jgi:hypothetical protein
MDLKLPTKDNSNADPPDPFAIQSVNYCSVVRMELIRIETHYDGKSERLSRTIGVLLVDGRFWSDTIEDYDYGWDEKTPLSKIAETKKKFKGKTAIPSGEYFVYIGGGVKSKFGSEALIVSKAWKKDSVPGFTGIRMHAGKHSGFTEGCILIGVNTPLSNQLATPDSLPFDSKKLTNKGNAKWISPWLRDVISQRGGMAKLTIRRSYVSQEVPKMSLIKKKDSERLIDLKKARNDTIMLNNIGVKNIKAFKPFLPGNSWDKMPSRNSTKIRDK